MRFEVFPSTFERLSKFGADGIKIHILSDHSKDCKSKDGQSFASASSKDS